MSIGLLGIPFILDSGSGGSPSTTDIVEFDLTLAEVEEFTLTLVETEEITLDLSITEAV